MKAPLPLWKTTRESTDSWPLKWKLPYSTPTTTPSGMYFPSVHVGRIQLLSLRWKATTHNNQVPSVLWYYKVLFVFFHYYRYSFDEVCNNPTFDFVNHKGDMIASHLIHSEVWYRNTEIYNNSVISLELHEVQDITKRKGWSSHVLKNSMILIFWYNIMNPQLLTK